MSAAFLGFVQLLVLIALGASYLPNVNTVLARIVAVIGFVFLCLLLFSI